MILELDEKRMNLPVAFVRVISMALSVSHVSSWCLLSTREAAIVERESGSTTSIKRATVRGCILEASVPVQSLTERLGLPNAKTIAPIKTLSTR
jgi:hypothetical protein